MENNSTKVPKVSAIVLTKNEAERLSSCLRSLSWADEIIVVDNMSTDTTITLARKFGAKVIQSADSDFSKLRNIGAASSIGDWLLYVDADEIVSTKLAEEIHATVSDFNSGSHAGYFIKRNNHYLGHEWPVMDQMQRLFYKKSFLGWSGTLHESASIRGMYGYLQEPLIHHTHRTLDEMLTKTNKWSNAEAQLRISINHPIVTWWRLIRVCITGFINSYFGEAGYRAGTVGLIEGMYQGFSLFITYAKLWELQQKQIKG